MGAKTARTETDLVRRLEEARGATDALFDLVRPESLYERPIPERHRLVFYLGHLEAFDWNLIGRGALDLASFHPTFDRLFAFGIDPDSSELPSDRVSDWPAVEETRSYNARVRSRMDAALAEAPEHLLHVAIEHRLMHAETFAYLLHNLEYGHKAAGAQPAPASARLTPEIMVPIPAGRAVLGAAGAGFGWDNEYDRHEVDAGAFSIGKYKVSNGQYLDFVREGGSPPHFWRRHSGRWFYRGMFGDAPLPLDWPVYVSHEQASAYAAWRGKRLPTEAEFHRAAYPEPFQPDPVRDNFDFRSWDPVAVHASPENANGVVQMVGNGWEWTATEFAPFEGFRTFDFYPGYSAPFFDGRHYVLKGASPRTAEKLIRPSFRNWFRGAYPYTYSTFRLAESG